MSAHTPGPWRLIGDGELDSPHLAGFPLTIAGPADDDLANVYSRENATVAIPHKESIANARVMAAAPDMLAALVAALPAVTAAAAEHPNWTDHYSGQVQDPFGLHALAGQITAAITKAKGTP